MSNPPAVEIPAGHLNIIDGLLARYELQRIGVRDVPGSVLNDNYLVETDRGNRFARIHRSARDRAAIAREHRAIRWAGAHGIPVALPIEDSEGHTFHRIGGRFASLSPWVEGRIPQRGALTPGEAATLGDLLGRLHDTLADYGDPALETGKVGSEWDTDQSIGLLDRVDDLIRYYPAPPEEELRVQAALRFQRALLEGGEARSPRDFDGLPRQPSHGDFHERNVLLGPDGSVAALVDWEMVSLLPRVFEVARSATFMGLLDVPAAFDGFLAAYRSWIPLTLAECEAEVEMWWQCTLHDTWMYHQRFIEGNQRVERFFAETDTRLRRLAVPSFRAWLAARIAA